MYVRSAHNVTIHILDGEPSPTARARCGATPKYSEWTGQDSWLMFSEDIAEVTKDGYDSAELLCRRCSRQRSTKPKAPRREHHLMSLFRDMRQA